jgi:hypothetical protein
MARPAASTSAQGDLSITGIGWINEHGDTGSLRQHFAQELEPLCR